MQKLAITAILFVLGLWLWNEYFRAIPNLDEAGVLKNFQLDVIAPYEATYTVIDKRFVAPRRGVIHAASPYVGGFNDLAYVSNIDVLLRTTAEPLPVALTLDEVRRCYFSEQALSAAEVQQLAQQTQHLSLIANTEQVANQIRRLKAGQKVMLSGELVSVHSKTIQHRFQVGVGSSFASQCQILKVNEIRIYA